MKNHFKIAFIGLLWATAVLSAQTTGPQLKVIVYPPEAISDSAKLNKAKYDERYPGIDISSIGLVDEGWYVKYKHERLIYLYGPIENLDYARAQKALLEEIRLSLVLKQPKLSSSSVELIRFSFSSAEFDKPAIIGEAK